MCLYDRASVGRAVCQLYEERSCLLARVCWWSTSRLVSLSHQLLGKSKWNVEKKIWKITCPSLYWKRKRPPRSRTGQQEEKGRREGEGVSLRDSERSACACEINRPPARSHVSQIAQSKQSRSKKKKESEKEKEKKERNEAKKRPGASSWKKMILLKTQRVIAEVRMHPCCASGVSDGDVRRDSRQASDRDRPWATLRISLNPVRSSIVQDLRLLKIDSSLVSRSPSIFLFLSVFLADKCVFQVMSINESISSNREAAKPCQIGKIVCLLHSKMLPFYGAPPQTPLGGSTPPRPPPAKHLHSPLATPLLRDSERSACACENKQTTVWKAFTTLGDTFQISVRERVIDITRQGER